VAPVAKADRQPAPKLVYLKVATTALDRLGLSEESIKRYICRGCGNGSIPYVIRADDRMPPAWFWNNPNTITFRASDITSLWIEDMVTLHDVQVDWNPIAAAYPKAKLRELGVVPVVVAFAEPLLQWLGTWFERLLRGRPLSLKEWAINTVRRMRDEGKITAGMKQSEIAEKLAVESGPASEAGILTQSYKASYLENRLKEWGIYPLR